MGISIKQRFAPLGETFDAFIVDIWGVLMDGAAPYPGARECLQQLRHLGKKIILLSNAPRQASSVSRRLAAIGIDRPLYDHILTSGEASRRALSERSSPHTASLGRLYFHIGPEKDQDLLQGLEYVETENIGEAEFVLVTGVIDDHDRLERYEKYLKIGVELTLPMICANPDTVVVRQNGDRVMCAGAIASRYQEIGGKAHYFGKPYQEFYESCLDALGSSTQGRVLAVGDTLHTDIKGAQYAGLTTALVLGGVLAKQLKIAWGETPHPECLEKLCASQDIFPDFALPVFKW